jgi:hypothetical protein
MSLKIQGGIVNINEYHDNSTEYNIDARGKDLAEVLRACQTEDITPVQEVKTEQKQTLPFLVIDKLTELGTYSIMEFEVLYHEAVKGGAPKLAKFIKHYRELKVLDTKGLNKKETFEQLKAFFGDELNYDYPNFTAYY